ncbi:MAG: NAD(P)-binding domain-containing protein [Kofleriaceae bacterium]
MTWVVPLALGGFAVLLMAVFSIVSAHRRHRAAISPAKTIGPQILVHDINDDRCTGCDACVAVCPTNVLDLVANKSRVLRFEDCIQCEACMFACPTEALVMFPEGSTPPPLKIPEVDGNFQTAVPGQYLIGEVAGKPLVKNAANLGRSVIEHMIAGGLRPGAIGSAEGAVDVAIVGSGPGGLSAALSCIQRGLSYVVLEKEQLLASTIARYPKGKLVMAEPYDTVNLSLLPVFDSSKEQLIPIWKELMDRVGIRIRQGESVEVVTRGSDGNFEVRTTVASYRAQRVVLSIGTRGKPRTLQVPGENLPKVFSLLDDPDDWRGRAVLVVGGGDSACEAALALADAGAKVMISYRGKAFNRAAPKNKQAIEAYSSQGRIKAKLGSQVLAFDAESVTLALSDGTQKRYTNHAAFVLIGADPPVQWLEKMGIRFVERPHQHQMGKTDDIVRRLVQRAAECPQDAARAAAQVLGGATALPQDVVSLPDLGATDIDERFNSQHYDPNLTENIDDQVPVSGPRKWLRSATSIFSTRNGTNPQPVAKSEQPRAGRRRLDGPMPLSEFAKRGKERAHTGHGRRDALSAGERTRILRMLRDEGGRLADEDSKVYIGAAPPGPKDYDFDLDDKPAVAPAPPRPDVPAKPAVVVGIAAAQSRRGKRPSAAPPPVPPRARPPSASPPPPVVAPAPPVVPAVVRPRRSVPPPFGSGKPPTRKPFPAQFTDEPTRPVDDKLLAMLRSTPDAAPPAQGLGAPASEAPMFLSTPVEAGNVTMDIDPYEDTSAAFIEDRPPADPKIAKFLSQPPTTDPDVPGIEDHRDDPLDSTQLDESAHHAIAEMERARSLGLPEENTRAVNIRNDRPMSDIDWDLE